MSEISTADLLTLTHQLASPTEEECGNRGWKLPSTFQESRQGWDQSFPEFGPLHTRDPWALLWQGSRNPCRRSCRPHPLLKQKYLFVRQPCQMKALHRILSSHLPSTQPLTLHCPLASLSSTRRGPGPAIGGGGGTSPTSMTKASTEVPTYRHWIAKLTQKVRLSKGVRPHELSLDSKRSQLPNPLLRIHG